VIGRAQRLYGVSIHLLVWLSNHWHGLMSFADLTRITSISNP